MDDANRVLAELACPRCGETQRMAVRFRYGPAGHAPLELGERIEWRPGGAVLDGPSLDPLLEVAGIASCPRCASVAAGFARTQWKIIRRACDGETPALPARGRAREERLGPLLALLDHGAAFREARELGGQVISRPGRYVEKLAELVLGYSPAQFDRFVAVVRIERDRLAGVRLLPAAVQDALRVFPVSIHFGALSAAVPTLARLADAKGEAWLSDALFRLSLRLELESWWSLHGEADGRLELVSKLRALLDQLPWSSACLEPLARLDRFSAAEEFEHAFAELSRELPEELAGVGDPVRILARWAGVEAP